MWFKCITITQTIHSVKCVVRRYGIFRYAIVAMLGLTTVPSFSDTEPVVVPPFGIGCIGKINDVQRIRDNLEIALTYVSASKDNFGPSRQRALAMVRLAIDEFDLLNGESKVAPSPGTEIAQYLGRHRHPRMNRALGALQGAERDTSNLRCRNVQRLEPMQRAIANAIAAIFDAFTFNPPGSGS